MVGEVDGEIAQTVKLEVTEGSGEGLFPNMGDMDRIWMVISPLTTKNKAYNYTWEMELVDESPDPVDTGDGSGNGGSVEGEVGGCACSASSAESKTPWALLLMGALWTRRRRHR